MSGDTEKMKEARRRIRTKIMNDLFFQINYSLNRHPLVGEKSSKEVNQNTEDEVKKDVIEYLKNNS